MCGVSLGGNILRGEVRIPHRRRPPALALALLTVVGCSASSDGWTRVPLTGRITLGRIKNVEEIAGTITFVPDGGIEGPAATTEIKDGMYQFTAENGPVSGKHAVILQLVWPQSITPPKTNEPLNPRTDPNVKGNEKCHFLPQQRLSATIPAEPPYTVNLTATLPENLE